MMANPMLNQALIYLTVSALFPAAAFYSLWVSAKILGYIAYLSEEISKMLSKNKA